MYGIPSVGSIKQLINLHCLDCEDMNKYVYTRALLTALHVQNSTSMRCTCFDNNINRK